MALGMMGIKLGMTQLFGENGNVIPVTVIGVPPNFISQVKTEDKEGYNALQLAFGDIPEPAEGFERSRRINRPKLGHLKKSGVNPMRWLKEFRVSDTSEYKSGDPITCEIFAETVSVDVTATSKGRGFQGNIKRHGHSRGPMSHGSRAHRRVCSIGSSATPARVRKGQKMPGQMGNVNKTTRNLEVVEVDTENSLIIVRGAVPGANGSRVVIKPSNKERKS
ncbi:MAG: 50S ribosomal protein L3 [bacterium]|nr:50S ribosomal protein L3 [bacterium]